MKRKRQSVFITLAAALAAALFLLSTCIPFGPPDDYQYDYDDFTWTNVDYSPDGGTVTIWLDGSMPVRQSRAINLKWAQIGHDFFEVAFLYGSTVARATWETGHAAGINGVERGVDYASAVPAAGQGSAILFVGKKSDKTLLGLGRLIGTDDAEGGATFVSANTRRVTFQVAAIDVGVRYKRDVIDGTTPASSFFTAASSGSGTTVNEQNTVTRRVRIGRQHFPLFRFEAVTRNVYAEYTFKVYDPDGTIDINTFLNGILQAGPAAFAELPTGEKHLAPRYPMGDGTWETNLLPPMSKESTTDVSFRNNLTGNNNSPFQNPVQFTFGILAANDGKVFAFSFEVPVYPLVNAGSPGTWYLRPGYDSYKYDLDDGEGGTGGAILIGTGNFADSSYYLWVKPPEKVVYPGETNYQLNLYGIMAELRAGNEEEYSILQTILSIPPQDGYGDYDPNLKFYVTRTDGVRTEISQDDNLQPYFLQGSNPNPDYVINGMLDITVEYTDSGIIYPSSFTLFLYTGGGTPGSDLIPETNRFVIGAQNELNGYMDIVEANPGNYIFVFFDSFDIPPVVLNGGGGGGAYYIIIIAARPNVVIGKTGTFAFSVPISANGSTFYLGKWPFNETLSVQGLAINSYPLTVNTGAAGYFIDNAATIEVVEGPGFTTIGSGALNR